MCSCKKYTTFTYFRIYSFTLYGEYRLCRRAHSSELKHLLKIEIYFLSLKTMISRVKKHFASGLFNCELDKLVDGTNLFLNMCCFNEYMEEDKSQTFFRDA